MTSWPEFAGCVRRIARLSGACGIASIATAAVPSFYDARVAPIFEQHCTVCHGEKKQKAQLRLDSYEALRKGGDAGPVVKPGDAKASELYRRITLPHDDDEVMPGDGKPPLSASEIRVIELWIARGASREEPASEFVDAPPPARPKAATIAAAPDWRPKAAAIAAFERESGLRLVPRSQVATDGLILRTASAPTRCDDAALARLAPVAELVVDVELARTKVTDAGLKSLAACSNLRSVDLTRTAVTSAGVEALVGLSKLEAINLTATAVDDAGVKRLRAVPTLRRIWVFGTKASAEPEPAKVATQ